jgi:hypothetical protein
MRLYVPETKRPPRLGDADGPNEKKTLRWEPTQIGQRGQAQSSRLRRALFLDGLRRGSDARLCPELRSRPRPHWNRSSRCGEADLGISRPGFSSTRRSRTYR